jgi:zinc protease
MSLPAVWVGVLATVLSYAPAVAPAADPVVAEAAAFNKAVKEAVLDNGLRVVVLERRTVPIVVTDVFYRVGGVHEEKGRTGLAHFLEHMMFKGTAKLAKGEIDALTLVHGGHNNAETWEDFTHYWFQFPSDRWEKALEIEADRMTGLVLDAKEFESERAVVLEELRGGRDTPTGRLSEQHTAISFLSHPYRNPVIGWQDEVERLTIEDMRAFYRRHYRPDNAVLVIVGDVSADEAISKARAAFAGVQRPKEPLPADIRPVEPPQAGRRNFALDKGGPQHHGLLGWHTVPAGHADGPALDVLSVVLGDSRSGLLGGVMAGEENWTGTVSAGHDDRRYGGQFTVEITAPHDFKPAAVEKKILAEIAAVRTDADAIEDKEVARAKRKIIAQFAFSADSTRDLAAGLGSSAMRTGWKAYADHYRDVSAVTAADVRRVAAKYLTDENLTVGWCLASEDDAGGGSGKGGKPVASAGGESSGAGGGGSGREKGRVIEPAPVRGPLPTGSPKLGGWTPERFVLPNGLTVLALRRPGSATAAVRIFVDAGQVREEKPGVAHLTGHLLDAGAGKRSADEISEALDDLGATLDVGAEGIALRLRSSDLPAGLELAADVLLNPTFPQEQFDHVRAAAVADLAGEADSPETLAVRALYRKVYGGHPLGRSPEGSAESLDKLTRADVVAHHRKWFVPGNAVMAVVGDFDPAALRSAIERSFGMWKGAKPAAPASAPAVPPRAAKGTAETIDKSREQVHICVGHLGIRRDDPDYLALLVADYILGAGDGMSNRLSRVLRDERGLAYTVTADITASAGIEPGVFSAYMAVKPENRKAAVEGILAEIRRMASGDATPDEVARVKAHLTGSWVFGYEGSDAAAERLLEAERFGLGTDYPTRFPKLVADVTVEAVRKAAARHFDADACHVIQVGPAK